MDVRGWPLDKIMQLPDCCFGRRWPVVTSRPVAAGVTDEWLAEAALPDKCVLWGMNVFVGCIFAGYGWCKFALGDHEPANDGEFDAFERIISGDFDNAAVEGAIYCWEDVTVLSDLRLPLFPQGRRFAVQAFNAHSTEDMRFVAAFVISSIPTEVPDCLLSR